MRGLFIDHNRKFSAFMYLSKRTNTSSVKKSGVEDTRTTVSQVLEPPAKMKLFFVMGRFQFLMGQMWWGGDASHTTYGVLIIDNCAQVK